MIHVVLYEPEIPGNTGNIMRTCSALNMVLHLIEPLGFYMDEKHLRRSGMDYRDNLEYHIHKNWEAFLKESKASNLYYVTRYATKTPDKFDFKEYDEDVFLVFGKESTGIPKHILKENLDRCIRIPMVAEARSLNLSNSVAIVAYEAISQFDYPGLVKHETLKGENFLLKYKGKD